MPVFTRLKDIKQMVASFILMRVRELMSYPISIVKPNATVRDAVRTMVDGKKGCVLVAEEGLLKECQGIVTTSLLYRKVFAEGLDPGKVMVKDIMTPSPLITVGPNATAKEAAGLMMKHDIRRLPVVEGGTLVGIITSKDLLSCVE